MSDRISNYMAMSKQAPPGGSKFADEYLIQTASARVAALDGLLREGNGKLLVHLLEREDLLTTLPPFCRFHLAEGFRLRNAEGDRDKALVVYYEDRLVCYARRLFRDRARRVVEVHADGTVVIHGRSSEHRFRIAERYNVTVTGDFIRFIDRAGNDLGRIHLPWLFPEDRKELARRFGEEVEHGRDDEALRAATAAGIRGV